MLLSQAPSSADATTLPYNPHTHSRRRPKLSLNTTAAASCIPVHLTASSSSSSSSTSTPLSPTTRNTMQNKYLTASTRAPRPVSPESASSESSDDEYPAPIRRSGMTSSYHPTTPKAGFYQRRRVMFSETVVVIPRD